MMVQQTKFKAMEGTYETRVDTNKKSKQWKEHIKKEQIIGVAQEKKISKQWKEHIK